MKKIFLTIALGLFLAIFISPPSVSVAEEKEVKAAVVVAATVPSKVCSQYSSVSTNVIEVLADASQKVTVTVLLKDCAQVVMPNIPVALKSDRGALDVINYIDSDGKVVTEGNGVGVTGVTDASGNAFFTVSSKVPGKTVISTKVDNLVDLDDFTITFKQLPFPKYVTITAQVPRFISQTGKITLFKPAQDDTVGANELVDMSVEVVIPEWSMVLGVSVFSLNLILFIIIIFLLWRLKKIDLAEEKMIESQEALVQEIAKNEGIREEQDNKNLPPRI